DVCSSDLAPNFLLWHIKPISVAMNQYRALDQIPLRRLVPVSPMLCEFSFLDELVENVLDLLPRARRRVEVFQNALQVHPAVRGLLDVAEKILFTKVRLRLPPRHTTSR